MKRSPRVDNVFASVDGSPMLKRSCNCLLMKEKIVIDGVIESFIYAVFV